jgi:hypothetical protein
VWQKNTIRMNQTFTYPIAVLGRPADECIYLAGIYGPPDPPMAQAYGMWRTQKLYSMCFWAFDQFCLNSRPVPLEVWTQSQASATQYHKPNAARAFEAAHASEVLTPAAGAINRFKNNQRALNE